MDNNFWADSNQFLIAFIAAAFVVYNAAMMWRRFFYQTATERAAEGFARTKEEAELAMALKTDKNKEEEKDKSANGAGVNRDNRDEELESMLRSFIEFYNASKEDNVDNVDNVDNSVDSSASNNPEDGAPISKAEKSVNVDNGDNGSTEHNKDLGNDPDADNDDAPGDVADTEQVVKTAENESVDNNEDNNDNSVEDSGKNHNASPAGSGASELEAAVVALSKKNLMLETALRGGISVEAAEALSGSTVEEKLAKLDLVREARPTRGTESLRETRVNSLVKAALGE